MNSEGLICPACSHFFAKEDHIPLIVPICGHTFCSSCIQSWISKLEPEESFICPEDKSSMTHKPLTIAQFPKNLMVMRLVEQREHAIPVRHTIGARISNFFNKKTDFHAGERIFYPAQDVTSLIKEPPLSPLSPKNYSTIRATLTRQNSSMNGSDNNICPEHGKKIDFICLNHQCRICANCALVGSHKNHDIKPEEDIMKEITARADRLIDVIHGLENTDTIMPEEQFNEILDWKLKEKANELEEQIHTKFEEYVAAIRAKEEEIIDQIKARLSLTENQLHGSNKYPENFQGQMKAWKQNSQALLINISEKADKGEIIYDLLEDKYSMRPDIIVEGEELVRKINGYTAIPLETIEKELEKISLIFNDRFKNITDTLCKFAPVQRESSKKNSEPGSEQNIEKPRIETLNNKIRVSIDKNFSNDNNLLNFEWKELASHDHSPQFNGRRATFGTFTQIGAPFGINKSEFLSAMIDNIDPANKSSILSMNSECTPKMLALDFTKVQSGDSSIIRSHRTPRDTASTTATTCKSTSPAPLGRNISHGEQANKVIKPKKKLKVPTKYEKLIEALEADKVEVADLFDADLGDNGVSALSEFIKGNKGLKTLKLVKNKISDEGATALINALSKNNTLEVLHLSQNFLTEKTLDMFLELAKTKTGLKALSLNRNPINPRNSKAKIKELTDLGVSVNL